MSADLAWCAAVVVVAFAVQGALGFGASLLALALCAWRLPIHELLPVLVPLNCLATALIVALDRAHVARRLLLGRLFPLMVPGVVAGALLAGRAGDATLRRLYGLVVVVLAVHGLARLLRGRPAGAPAAGEAPGAPVQLGRGGAWVVAAGVVHGVFATGGPLVVLALDRLGLDPRAFRGTLACLWLALNGLLVATYAAQGRLDANTLALSAALVPALAAGLALGHALHTRLDAVRLRLAVLGLLVVAGLQLAA